MTQRHERIGVYYSHGQNFALVLQGVRRMHPSSHIIAIVPNNYEITSAEVTSCDSVVYTERALYPITAVAAIGRLIRQIRALKCSLFVVLFKSRQLQVFGSLSGAQACECWGVDSRVHSLQSSLRSALLQIIIGAASGWVHYVTLWWHARLVRIRVNDGRRGR